MWAGMHLVALKWANFGNTSQSTVPIDLDWAPAPTLPSMGLLDLNLYIYEHPLTLLTFTLKKDPKVKSISRMNHHKAQNQGVISQKE
jgi:hypothetical protein